MATYIRIACLALERACDTPAVESVDYALYRCRLYYAQSGSKASIDMLREATALADKKAA
jgi:hypothetical protein